MKRVEAGETFDATHPVVCFHREVLTNLKWSNIRRDFLEALQTNSQLKFTEPKKLWRHSQEALGKWVLSQVARETRSELTNLQNYSFFPISHNSLSENNITYDEQLVRDISLKCENSSSKEVITEIKQLLIKFNLSKRCKEAEMMVQEELETTTPFNFCKPLVRIIDSNEEETRTISQRRVEGSIVEIGIKWPQNIPRHMRRGCPPVSIPLAAYKKLDMCYRYFSDKTESIRYSRLDYGTRFILRAATLALRYEGCLATGSLQLCADTRLKQHLHASGYHVIDLCASPINAYMGSPKIGSYNNNNDKNNNSSSLENENMPNYFCSAFPDTDCYFGSLGSALNFDIEKSYKSPDINPEGKPLLLTLDVPYDEDLCERLFMKLIIDMKNVEILNSNKEVPFIADYVLVLPLWWNVPMQRKKILFTETNTNNKNNNSSIESLSNENLSTLDNIVKDRCKMLQEGYTVSYEWPQRLAEAAGEKWVSFDGVFVGGSYEYFCTATNKWLRGVTATEVIGLAQPREQNKKGPLLENLLSNFYGCH